MPGHCARNMFAFSVFLVIFHAPLSYSQDATTFGDCNACLRDPTPEELSLIQGVADGTVIPDYPFAFPRPNSVRCFVLRPDVCRTIDSSEPPAGVTGEENPNGEIEIGLHPDLLDPDNPAPLAEVLDHEHGHADDHAKGVDDSDHVEGEPWRQDFEGRQEHFRVYRSALEALCQFIQTACFDLEPGLHDVDLLCAHFKVGSTEAKGRKYRLAFPPQDLPPPIECEWCPCQR